MTVTQDVRGAPSSKARRARDEAEFAPPATRLVAPSDAMKAALLLLELAIAATTPARTWPAAAQRIAGLLGRLSPGRAESLAGGVPPGLAGRAGWRSLDDAQLALDTASIEHGIHLSRTWLPRGWRPAIELEGEEYLQRALAEDRGAILWVTEFASAGLVAKMALCRAGYDVSHLSRPTHGFSETRLGMRLLNPIQTRAEGRLLRERIVIEPGTHVAAMRRLRARLRENGVVSITVADLARQTMAAPFLGGHLRLPTGPLSLARSSGASLLPVHCVRDDAGGFTVHIAEPLTIGSRQDGDAGFARALDQYLRSLAPHVERHPEQWLGWQSGRAPADEG